MVETTRSNFSQDSDFQKSSGRTKAGELNDLKHNSNEADYALKKLLTCAEKLKKRPVRGKTKLLSAKQPSPIKQDPSIRCKSMLIKEEIQDVDKFPEIQRDD